MANFYTPFGERLRRGRPRPQPKRRARAVDVARTQKTRKEMTPNEIALDDLKKAFKPYQISPELIRQFQVEARQLESLRYMNMDTLAAALILLFRFEQAGIPPALFSDTTLIDYLQPYRHLLSLPDAEFEVVAPQVDVNVLQYLRVLRTIDNSMNQIIEYLLPPTKAPEERKQKAGKEERDERADRAALITRHKASVLRYIRAIYFFRREREQAMQTARFVEPVQPEQLIA